MTDWRPLADPIIEHPSPNYGYPGETVRWRAVTWHITEGALGGTLSWLCDPSSNASAHFVVARDGSIYHLVDLDQAAWAQGRAVMSDLSNPIIRQTVDAGINPNLRSYSIECVGLSSWGKGGSLTQPQSDALIRLTAFLCLRSKLTADRTHIIGHYQWDGVGRAGCPGFSFPEWQEWIGRVRALALFWRGW